MSKPGAVKRCGNLLEYEAQTKIKNNKFARDKAIKVSYDHYGQILNYNTSTAVGSHLFTSLSPKDHMRQFLLGTVTAGALMLYGGRNAKAGPDVCTGLGTTTYTCQGDQSGGVNYGVTATLTTLNVNNLTADAGSISVAKTGDITVNVDTDAFAIDTTNTGISASSNTGKVTINSTGDISSDNSRGIYAKSFGAGEINVKNTGIIQSDSQGIWAESTGGGIIVDSTGDITSTNQHGIYARDNGAGSVYVKSRGNFQGKYEGIVGRSLGGGGVKIDSIGNINATDDQGIFAQDLAAGAVDVKTNGNIESLQDVIYARSSGGGVKIDSTGDLTSQTEKGIDARDLGNGAVEIKNNGKIQADDDGIYALSSTGKVTIDSTGFITSNTNRGIYARNNGASEISVINDGNIHAQFDGILAFSTADGKVTVNSTGDIISDTNRGILAQTSGAGEIFIINDGNIQARGFGIYATSLTGNLTIDSTGNITSTKRGIHSQTSGAGEIFVTNDGKIQASSIGISAFSIADGKVTIDTSGDISSLLNSGIHAQNNGTGEILVRNDGEIQSRQDGIHAHSGTGKVTVDSTGDITSGTGDGIDVATAGDLTVQIRVGTIKGADDGIDFTGGATNSLTNYGSLLGGNNAIEGDIGNETVHNHGAVIGNVDLGTGTNSFNNKITGIFKSGAIVNLGDGTLTNEGTISPGDINTVQTTTLTGDLVQTSNGQFVVDIDEGAAGADIVTITGTANLAGKIAPNVINIVNQNAGQIKIAEAAGGISLAGLTAIDGFGFDFDVLVQGNDLFLTWEAISSVLSLLNVPLTPNQLSTVTYIDTIIANGSASPELAALLSKLINLGSEEELRAALDQLHSEAYLASAPTTLFSNLDFAKSMLSCSQYELGSKSHLKEGECYWAKISGRNINQDKTLNNIAINEDAYAFTGGIQFALSPSWYLGLATSYEDTNSDIDTRATTEGYRAQFGGVLKTQIHGTTFSAGLTGGFGSFDTKRYINFGGLNLVAEGEQDINFGSGHVRLAHSFDMGGWYARPIMDASLTYLKLEGLQENGGGATNLTLQSVDDWYLSLSPSIEFGTEIKHSSGAIIRPYLRAGITYFEKNDIAVNTFFSGASSGINAFQISTEFDDLFADIEIGVNIVNSSGLNFKLNYEGHFSEDIQDHSAGIKLGIKF